MWWDWLDKNIMGSFPQRGKDSWYADRDVHQRQSQEGGVVSLLVGCPRGFVRHSIIELIIRSWDLSKDCTSKSWWPTILQNLKMSVHGLGSQYPAKAMRMNATKFISTPYILRTGLIIKKGAKWRAALWWGRMEYRDAPPKGYSSTDMAFRGMESLASLDRVVDYAEYYKRTIYWNAQLIWQWMGSFHKFRWQRSPLNCVTELKAMWNERQRCGGPPNNRRTSLRAQEVWNCTLILFW